MASTGTQRPPLPRLRRRGGLRLGLSLTCLRITIPLRRHRSFDRLRRPRRRPGALSAA
jgi:hypothetical protein